MTIYTVADILCVFLEAIMFHMVFKAFLGKRENIPEAVYNGGIILLTAFMYLSNVLFNFGYLNLIVMVSLAFIYSFLHLGSIKIKIIISVLAILLLSAIEMTILFVMPFVIHVTITELVDNPLLRLYGMIISKTITFAIIRFICFKKKRYFINFSIKDWIVFFAIFATAIAAFSLIFLLQYYNPIKELYVLSVGCCVGLLLITFFALYLYEIMATQSEEINRRQLFEQQVKSQSKHFDEILLSQNELNTFKHDFKNHLIALSAYFKDKKSDSGLEYIKQIEKMDIPGHSKIDTGNISLDIILNTKIKLAKSKGVSVDTRLQIPENLPIDAVDFCIIFGNALDNAIEACDKIIDKNKNISISAIYERDSVICKIKNTMAEPNHALGTTKEDGKKHGFGIENIKTALKKYKHVFKITQTDSEFTLLFTIFI